MEKKEKTPTKSETQRGSLQDKKAEEYLREGGNIEDMPTAHDQEEAEKILKDTAQKTGRIVDPAQGDSK